MAVWLVAVIRILHATILVAHALPVVVWIATLIGITTVVVLILIPILRTVVMSI